ncbi:hypothetical protein BH20GEM1_BH20GEM1_00900 [soil metagenome]
MVTKTTEVPSSREVSKHKTRTPRPIGIRDLAWASSAALYRIVLNLLPVGIHIRLAILRGKLYRKMLGTPRHVVENLTAAFGTMGPSEIHDIARRHVEFSQETNLERILPLLTSFRKACGCRIEGERYLESVLGQGKGGFLLTAHFGYARLIEPLLKSRGYDALRVVARTPRGGLIRSQRWEQWAQKHGRWARGFADLFLFDLLRSNNIAAELDIRPILRALAERKLIVVAGDGLVSTDFIKMNFLDQQYPFATGYIKIAMLTRSPIIPVFARRGSHEIVLEVLRPIEVREDSKLEDIIQECVQILENRVKLTPHLWDRWSNNDVWSRVLEWYEKNPEDRFLRHNPWGRNSRFSPQ